MLEPNVVVIYVDNLAKSSHFYQDILGLNPKESSATFNLFKLSNGMGIGLKDKQFVQPKPDGKGGNEIAFTVGNNETVDTLYLEWQKKEIQFAQSPTNLPFGYTFVALDPDGNRLRVVSLG
jgi:catechol 2,3-dioxygenase-like lactoylglutathione lyase family enzyme